MGEFLYVEWCDEMHDVENLFIFTPLKEKTANEQFTILHSYVVRIEINRSSTHRVYEQ